MVCNEFADEMGRTSLFFSEPSPNWVSVHAGPYPISEEVCRVQSCFFTLVLLKETLPARREQLLTAL